MIERLDQKQIWRSHDASVVISSDLLRKFITLYLDVACRSAMFNKQVCAFGPHWETRTTLV